MPYVIVTPHRTYAPPRSGEREALDLTDRWAERLDELDGEINMRYTDRSYGGRIRQVEIAPISPTLRRFGPGPARFSALQQVKRAYESAAFLSIHGQLGIAVGHGSSTPAQAWVDLAPAALLRVDVSFAEQVWRLREAGDAAPRPLSAEEQLFEDMVPSSESAGAFDGSISTRARWARVKRVSTCWTGCTTSGACRCAVCGASWRSPGTPSTSTFRPSFACCHLRASRTHGEDLGGPSRTSSFATRATGDARVTAVRS